MDIDLRVLGEVVGEWERAPWGKRGLVLAKRLPLLGISQGTFHRKRMKEFGDAKRRAGPTGRKKPEYEAAVQQIMKLKYSPLKGVRSLTTEDAMIMAAEQGCPEALDIPEGTVNRIARELGYHPRVQRRESRFEAARPNEWHQLDASRSEYFQCHHRIGEEWALKLSPAPFKNRDVRDSRERLWIYGLADDFSGLRVARYYIAKGENALDAMDFLQWAWSKHEDHAPFRGLPDHLYLDKGPLDKTKAFQDFCREVAGVEIHSHEAGRPQATGKVETGWKDLWRRFEARFFRQAGWQSRQFSLAELNQELAWYLRDHHNQRDHRRLKKMSKAEAWLTIQGVVDIEPEVWRHVFHREKRTLDAAGCFDFRGQPYQVAKEMPYPGGLRCEIYLGLRDGAVLVADPRDGRKFEAALFAPAPAGEFRSGERTPLERLLAEPDRAPETGDGESQAGKPVPPLTFRPDAEGKVVHLVRVEKTVISDQSSVISDTENGKRKTENLSLAELARGIEVVQPPAASSQPPGERLFATPLERYEHLVGRQARGEVVGEADREFLAWFKSEYREFLNLSPAAAPPALRII